MGTVLFVREVCLGSLRIRILPSFSGGSTLPSKWIKLIITLNLTYSNNSRSIYTEAASPSASAPKAAATEKH